MLKKTLYTVFIMGFIFALAAHAQMQSDNYSIPTSVLSGGGVPMKSASYEANSTLGQPSPLMDPADPPGSANYELKPGFWHTVKSEQPSVSVNLSPDSTSIPRGGSLGYSVTATNNTDSIQCFDYWSNVNLPSGAIYPPSGELFGPVNVCVGPYDTRSAHLGHSIPMGAPLGTYSYNGYVGPYPTVWDEDNFQFTVTATSAVEGAENWETTIDKGFTD